MNECLFCRIAQGAIASDIVYENERIVAFKDIAPKAPTHILVIPRKHIATINDICAEDTQLVGELVDTARQLAQQVGIAETGYRLIFNVNAGGGQAVYHIHLHLLGGRQLTWPPG